MYDQANKPLSRDAYAFVLAGGKGSRLRELTEKRAKPAVVFGGKNRIIDYALSNALNSGIKHIGVATQYKANSLIRHLQLAWTFFRPERNESFELLPAGQNSHGEQWYLGTADAVLQNIETIKKHNPKYVVILAGDHIYMMDYEIMLQDHIATNADVTIGCLEVTVEEGKSYGIMKTNSANRILEFLEKPENPPEMPGKPGYTQASMGIYVFETAKLYDYLVEDSNDPNSSRDFGKNIIPKIVAEGYAHAHHFSKSCIRSKESPEEMYWRDVGTLDAYFDANIDLTDITPKLDIYNREWPIWTYTEMGPPAKFVHDSELRRGSAVSSLVSNNCIISGSFVRRSLLSGNVRVNSYSVVEECIILPWAQIARNVKLRRVIIDRGVSIPEGLVVGEDPVLDAQRFRRTESGICLITQSMIDNLEL